jgi:hypothetical protein
MERTGRRGSIRKQLLDDANLEPYTATEFNNIISGRQPRRRVKVLQRFRVLFLSATDDLVSSTLKTGTESVPATLENFQALTRLSAREDFTEPLDDLQETRRYCKSQEEALDHTMW